MDRQLPGFSLLAQPTSPRLHKLAIVFELEASPSPVFTFLVIPIDAMPSEDRHPRTGSDSLTPPQAAVPEPRPYSPATPPVRSQDEGRIPVADNQSAKNSRQYARHEPTGIREEGEAKGEGVEREEFSTGDDDGRISEPFDPTKIRIATRQPTVDQVVERIRRHEIDLQPDFQRAGNIWPLGTKSRLIESLLLRIPLPVFYMAADPDDNWQVVDGLQRLSALRDFIVKKNLRLRGLEYLSRFDGRSYDELPRPMQRRISETQLSCHVIEPGTPPEVMFNVFKRINTEGKPLVGQEIRHALNPGLARDLLRELAESKEFKRATDGTIKAKRMADRECVLRFLAFRSMGDDLYAGKLDDYLMRAMKFLNENPASHVSLRADFRRAMSLASDVFGREAFRKPPRTGFTKQRSPVNKPLFESLSIALAEVPDDGTDLLRNRSMDLVSGLTTLMENSEFLESISVGTQTTRQVRIRFGRMRKLIHEVLS